MAKLTIKTMDSLATGKGMKAVQISGFSDGELNELKSMEHMEAKEKLLDMLDDRNDGIGTQWMCGDGVFGLWFDNEAAYLNVGTSCD
jgi:hypothetical protein